MRKIIQPMAAQGADQVIEFLPHGTPGPVLSCIA